MASGVDPIVGSIFGSFRVVKPIGRGGMGSVYLGEHTVIGSKVAIKVLHERLASDENLVARFYAEARAVNLIGHENIVNIFDMNVVPPSRYYLVMEYLEGKPLNHLLTAPVPMEVAVPILVQVCDALAAAHRMNIIHRDLKPENIFLIKRGRQENFVKVLDFGLAKILESTHSPGQTAAGLIVGTPEFMSPEQCNSMPVDGRADIYALGCIAWLLATARLPFPQRGLADLLVAHRQTMPPAPHVSNPKVPPAWSEVILKAMAKRPEDRFQSADEFAHAMEQALSSTGFVSAPLSPAHGLPKAPPPAAPPAVAPAPPAVAPALPKAPAAQAIAPPPPPPDSTVQKKAPRHEARFSAQVAGLDGKALGLLPCRDISRGGMFVCSSGPYPNLFSRVKVTLPHAGNLELLGEVVRHVPPDQAKAWNMEPGFGIQFHDVTPGLREQVERMIQGLPVQPQAAPQVPTEADDTAHRVLEQYRERVAGDHYEIIGAASDIDFTEVKNRVREAQRELEALKPRALTAAQRQQLEAALARVKAAADVLTYPTTRAEYDANRGNWKGVGYAIAAGLNSVDLDRIRGEFLKTRPNVAGSAHVKFLASKGYEATANIRQALDAIESALALDPLNFQLHQRRGVLLKKVRVGT